MTTPIRTLLAAALVLTLSATTSVAQIMIGTTDYGTDLKSAVDAASTGDVINVPDGTYVISPTITVDDGITIQGESEANTILQVNTGSGYGLLIQSDDVTIQDVTFQSVQTGTVGGYMIHAADPPTVFTNLALRRVTFFGDVTSPPKRRTALDIHGYDGVILEDVTSRDASSGNGMQFTGCKNVTASGITTSDNAWGSVAVYVSELFTTPRASENVVIDGNTFSGADGPTGTVASIYSQAAAGVDNINVSVTGFDYIVRNTDFRTEAPDYDYFRPDEADAIAFALAFVTFESASTIERITDGHFVVAPGMSIQTAVDTAPVGGTVEVRAGTYTEQVVISDDLDLIGDGLTTTTIVSPATLVSTMTRNSSNFKPVVSVIGGSASTIQGLTVDGAGNGAANRPFVGIGAANAGLTIDSCRVTAVREDPLNGNQHGLGIYAFYDDLGTHTATVTNCEVDDFQKNGITINGYGGTILDAIVTDNVVTGAGVLTADDGDPAQNGIQTQGVATTALVTGNTVSGINYDNTNNTTKYVATSILLYFGNNTVENNVVGPAQAGVYLLEGDGALRNNDVTVGKVGVSSYGLIVTDPPRAIPQGVDVESVAGPLSRRASAFTVVVEGNTLQTVGPDVIDTYGIEADMGYVDYAGDGPETMDLSILDNTITGFDYAVALFECTTGCTGSVFTSLAVNQNDFEGSTNGLYTDVSSVTVDASCNWWGDTSGPATATNPPGSGAALDGNAVYEPWLDGPGGNCNLSTNYASVGPAPSELAGCNDCIDIPVNLTRLDTSAARGVSVTFELSAELELCGTPTLSSGAGAFYDGYVGDVQEFFLDHNDGTYTYDTAILGGTCGPTVGGEAFTIPVTYVSGLTADTVGTIEITSVTLRDCANVPLPLLPGPGTTIDIDVEEPGAISDLTATQVKSGNDSNGTTKIDLAWTLPADLDLTAVTLYRKGFGNYPEYDDLGGTAPTTPADPASALSDGWTEVAVLAPNATAYTDEPSTRDFWYYVAFASDECYVSAVSGQTGGTLNYHLGDVAPAPNGNNLVLTGDISALGTAYGTVDGDATYNALADVGPTTDFSVDARPTTDNQIQFEDLIVFAINYNSVGRFAPVTPAALNELALVEPTTMTAGEEIVVPITLASDGTIQGMSTKITWNDDVLEYVGWAPGDLSSRQNRIAPVYSPTPGTFDVAVMGVTGQGLAGDGTLATMRFRVKQEGSTGFAFESVDARDDANQALSLQGSVVQTAPGSPALVSRSVLRSNVPNPFNPLTKVRFALSQAGRVDVKIYDVSGRLVRTLVSEVRTAGEHEVVWNGTDDNGRSVSSGTYLLRMQAPDRSESRRMTLIK